MPTNYSFVADATSAQNDGASVTAGGATIPIGGAAPADHAHLRFSTTSGTPIASTETVVSASLSVEVQAQGAAPINVDLWASQFGAAIAIGDYNGSANNYGISEGNAAGYRVKIAQILGSTAVVSDVGSVTVPSRFINKDASVNAGFSDFECRPGTGYVAGATAVTTIHGAGAASTPDKPTLTVVTLTDAELLAQNDYRDQAIGVDTYVAFAQETTPGTPVKGKVLLDIRSSNLDSYAQNLRSQSLSRQRARPRKLAVGRAGAGGEVPFEITPEKWDQILPGILKRTGTTGSGPYVHTFKVAQIADIKTFTFVKKVGDFRKVFPGCMVDSLTISANLDEVVMATVSVQARDEWTYDDTAAGGDTDAYILSSTAAYDSVANSMLSFVAAGVTVDGVEDRGLIQDFTVTLRQNVQERRGLSKKRGVTSHYPLGFEVDVNFNMYFEDVLQLRKFLGVSHRDFPFKAAKDIEFQSVQLDCAGINGETEQNLSILIPKMSYEVVRIPVNGEGAIMLNCSGFAAYDDVTTLSNVVLTITNSEPSTVFDASTDEITIQPAEVL